MKKKTVTNYIDPCRSRCTLSTGVQGNLKRGKISNRFASLQSDDTKSEATQLFLARILQSIIGLKDPSPRISTSQTQAIRQPFVCRSLLKYSTSPSPVFESLTVQKYISIALWCLWRTTTERQNQTPETIQTFQTIYCVRQRHSHGMFPIIHCIYWLKNQ